MRPKVLLLDDDKDLLDMYREILAQLPSGPEIFTATSGPRAIAMLEAEPFTLLVTDLNMPKMDGLQVLSIVRRKWPELRTVVLTSVVDEQFRSRVYSLGVDLFWQKPSSSDEIKQFLECLESLLNRQAQTGFRGVHSKSLVDIIQLECLSQTSMVLKIVNGSQVGRIWVGGGEVIDASTEDLNGVDAFRRILSWKGGAFETLAADPGRPRTIFNSYQGLLLETAQAADEAKVRKDSDANPISKSARAHAALAPIVRFPGVEFALVLKPNDEQAYEASGLGNAEPVAEWTRQSMERFRALGEVIQAGPLHQVEAIGPQAKVAMAQHDNHDFCIGWKSDMASAELQESTKKVLSLWVY